MNLSDISIKHIDLEGLEILPQIERLVLAHYPDTKTQKRHFDFEGAEMEATTDHATILFKLGCDRVGGDFVALSCGTANQKIYAGNDVNNLIVQFLQKII